MKKVTCDLSNVDWPLLREQKTAFLEIICKTKDSEKQKLLDGLLHLIDYIQDQVVDSGQVPANRVFDVGTIE